MGVNYTQNGRFYDQQFSIQRRFGGIVPFKKLTGWPFQASPEFFGESGTPKPDSR
jgi:hypothetical protein